MKAVIHECESKGIRAYGYQSDAGFVIRQGSMAVADNRVQNSLRERSKRISYRARLITEKILVPDAIGYRFAQDVVFNSPSEAASIIWGSNLNGRKVFGIAESESEFPSKDDGAFTRYFEIDDLRAIEGYRQDSVLAKTERDRQLVEQRKLKDNFTCQACGLKLVVNEKYVVECHHLVPVSLGVRETTMEDLVSLCPTCHRVAHMRQPPYLVHEIKEIIRFNQ